jgi:hypothetical protein
MAKETQISAQISDTTRKLMDKHVRRTGIKKGHLIEQALLHHLQALDELPAEYVVRPRIVVSRKTGEALLAATVVDPPPALYELMRDGRGPSEARRDTPEPRSRRIGEAEGRAEGDGRGPREARRDTPEARSRRIGEAEGRAEGDGD